MNAIELADKWNKYRSTVDLENAGEFGDLMEATIRRLHADNESLRKDAELHKQIQRACGDLPEGWEIRLSLENGAGWFDLFDDNGNHVEFASSHENLAETLSDAIDAAMGEGK